MIKVFYVNYILLLFITSSFATEKFAESFQCKSLSPQISISEVINKFSTFSSGNPTESSIIKVTQWGGRKDQFIIHVYNFGDKCYDTLNANNLELLSVIQHDSSSKTFSIIATIINPFEGVNLFTTNLNSDYDESMFEFDICDKIIKFDFAPYKLNGKVTTFGIRTGHHTGYAGGGAYSEMLHLFHIRDSKLLKVASTLIYHESSLAGEWFPDGTRGRDENEQKWVLIIGAESDNGYNDLILKEIGKKKSKLILEWNNKEKKYFKKEPKGL